MPRAASTTNRALAAASVGMARTEMQQAAFLGAGKGGDPAALEAVARHRHRRADALCTDTAATPDGHLARAFAICVRDDGELARRATADGVLECRLACALTSDLARE